MREAMSGWTPLSIYADMTSSPIEMSIVSYELILRDRAIGGSLWCVRSRHSRPAMLETNAESRPTSARQGFSAAVVRAGRIGPKLLHVRHAGSRGSRYRGETSRRSRDVAVIFRWATGRCCGDIAVGARAVAAISRVGGLMSARYRDARPA